MWSEYSFGIGAASLFADSFVLKPAIKGIIFYNCLYRTIFYIERLSTSFLLDWSIEMNVYFYPVIPMVEYVP